MSKLTWTNDDGGRFVVDGDGSVIGRNAHSLVVLIGHHLESSFFVKTLFLKLDSDQGCLISKAN